MYRIWWCIAALVYPSLAAWARTAVAAGQGCEALGEQTLEGESRGVYSRACQTAQPGTGIWLASDQEERDSVSKCRSSQCEEGGRFRTIGQNGGKGDFGRLGGGGGSDVEACQRVGTVEKESMGACQCTARKQQQWSVPIGIQILDGNLR